MIGRFAGLSCADIVNINSYYNGTKYSYLMYKNGSGINIDKISEIKDSTFKNGLEVIVNAEGSSSDLEKAIINLSLFENLYIEYKNSDTSRYYYDSIKSTVNLFNERKVYHFKSFSVCSTITMTSIRVGNIRYSSDSHLLRSIGIIINIPIGEVDITPNREELQFTKRTKEAIKKYTDIVKKELQDIVCKKLKSDFTLPEYYDVVTSSSYKCKCPEIDGNYIFNIDKYDVDVSGITCAINNKPVPKDFGNMISYLQHYYIIKDSIYKIFNAHLVTRSYYSGINKGNVTFDKILCGQANIGVKLDVTTRAVTTSYFKRKYNDKCIVVIQDLAELKNAVKQWVGSSFTNCETLIDYLFNLLPIYYLSNDDVPDSFKQQYKCSKSKDNIDTDTSYARVYTSVGYYNQNISKIKSSYGLTVYSNNIREDSIIRGLASFFDGCTSINFITVKKENLSIFENNRKFILLSDFLEFQNNILKKVVTSIMIQDNFNKLDNIDIFTLPIYREFRKKYKEYFRVCVSSSSPAKKYIESLIDNYKKRGWYNKADINYYSVNDSDIKIIKIMNQLESCPRETVKSLLFLMFGINKKIGLTKPKFNINKYLKQIKHERI